MSELQLLIGLVGAVGLALLGGTAAALLTYRRTGVLPGTPPEERPAALRRQVRVVQRRAVLGGVIAFGAVALMVAVG